MPLLWHTAQNFMAPTVERRYQFWLASRFRSDV